MILSFWDAFWFSWEELCVISLTFSKDILWDWVLWQHKFVILQFCRLGIWQRSHGATCKVLEGLCSLYGGSKGKWVSLSPSRICRFPQHVALPFVHFIISIESSSGHSKFHCGWINNTSRKRFLVDRTYK